MITLQHDAIDLIIGCMSGTSCDGIDAVAVAWEASHRPRLLAHVGHDLGDLGSQLLAASQGEALSAAKWSRLAAELAAAHAAVVAEVRQQLPRPPQLLAVHGQTVYHKPPLSWQLLNLPLLAQRCGLPVVGDLRAADLACGGQGAPITPLADVVLFPGTGRRAVVNLGGFVNYTVLEGDQVVQAADLCVGNQLLDAAARAVAGQPFDRDGALARSGQVNAEARDGLRAALQAQECGRSLGSGDERLSWLAQWRSRLAPADLLASAGDALAQVIIQALQVFQPQQIWLSGGGVHNAGVREQLHHWGVQAGMAVASSEDVGVPPTWREAAAMAILARRCLQRQPITVAAVTGCPAPAPVAGTWVLP